MPSKLRGGITYPYPNFIGYTVAICQWISNLISHFVTNVIFIYAGIKDNPCWWKDPKCVLVHVTDLDTLVVPPVPLKQFLVSRIDAAADIRGIWNTAMRLEPEI